MNKLAEKVGAWLLIKGNTKQKLADLIGCSVGTLNNHLAGVTDWSWSEVCALADALGCNLLDLR